MQNIETILELIKTDSSIMDIENAGQALISFLLDIAESDIESEDCKTAIETIEKICNANKNTPKVTEMYVSRIISVGIAAYSAKKYIIAETAFRMAAECGNISAKNNYAYMIRRHEIATSSHRDHIIALKMLQDGVKKGDAFSLVNTALVFALLLGDDESWHLSDLIFEKLSNFGSLLVRSWWEDLAKDNDIEGLLVIFFLLRYGKIEQSNIGSTKGLCARLKEEVENFPEWLSKDYTIETLDDVIECIDDPSFDTILEDFLENMPCTREHVDEMLEVVSGWVLWPVYNKLLTDCVALLSLEELAKLKTDYKENFSIPLPGEDE